MAVCAVVPLFLVFGSVLQVTPDDPAVGSWLGVVQDAAGRPLENARVELQRQSGAVIRTSFTDAAGRFQFLNLAPGLYAVSVRWQGQSASLTAGVDIPRAAQLKTALRISADLQVTVGSSTDKAAASGGEQLSDREVSGIPLNRRDFGQLLLLAAGTRTDTNGSVNFTQQFAVNGQRGVTSVFATDGMDTSDPELGGATFSNFNVDAIQELRSSSGVMPAEYGRGAAGFTNVITKSGTDRIHGSAFEFLRNAALDARNFFDRRSAAQPGRIPPFVRNEFGLTNGGPVYLPGVYDGRKRTFYFAQYQGFRQVLGTTQVLSVPTAGERRGLNTTAFPGDTLFVPVDPKIAPILAAYPLPNDPQGSYGPRTYAISSKVTTFSDQFSARIDHKISDKSQLFARFMVNHVDGPLTNPNQSAIDPSFATRFLDRQRNFGLSYIRTISTGFVAESTASVQRSTPSYPAINSTQPALKFADGVYEPYNSAAGGLTVFYGNLFQARQNIAWTSGNHAVKAGAEVRANRDTFFGASAPNGAYAFAGGAAYSPVAIRSASGSHNIAPGEPLPDALTGFLTATPFSFGIAVAPAGFPQGDRIGEVAIRRESYNFYVQDTWRLSSRLSLTYGVRYEVNSRMRAADNRTGGVIYTDLQGRRATPGDPSSQSRLLVNLSPEYDMDWAGWAPRLALDAKLDSRTRFRLGGAITTNLPNLAQVNLIMGGAPYVVSPLLVAAPGAPVRFENAVSPVILPPMYTPDGRLVFGPGQSSADVPPNTEVDVDRFGQDLAALTPDQRVRPISTIGVAQDFRNGYIASWSAGLARAVGDVSLDLSYVATAGIKLARIDFPNGTIGAGPAFAPYTRFDASGRVVGGFGPQYFITNRSHSSYHSLQTSVSRRLFRKGPGFQASYTFGKSLDDTSTVAFVPPQDPRNPGADKGPSIFDVAHGFAVSLAQELPAGSVPFLRPLGRRFTSGWQFFSVISLSTGSPFTINSGVQQTEAGASPSDRPDQVGQPELSTGRTVREDYFGRGAANSSLFSIPIGLPGGTGPNKGRFGTLGRNTLRGPGYRNFDIALIKDTLLVARGKSESVLLQFRAEFFNIFNIVNFGLPGHIVLSPGFGVINRTAGTSRQIQFSLKLLY